MTSVGQQGTIIAEKIGCDSMQVSYWLGISNPRMPLTFKYYTSNGVLIPTSGTTIDSSNLHTNGAVMVKQIIPGMDYGDQIQAYIYNSCGDSALSISIVTHPFIFYPKYSFNSCGTTANVAFTNTPYYEYHTSINTDASYTLTHVSTNTVVESGTVIGQLNPNNGYISITPTVIPGETYHFSITDGCGETFQSDFTIPGLAPPTIIWEFIASGACMDSVVGAYRINTEGFGTSAKLILLSGPSTLGSTKPEFAYSDTYTYPDTVGFNGDGFILGNLSIGTYQYKIIDDCGNELFASIVITPEQVTSLRRTTLTEKGCPGHNKIFYSMVNGGNVTIRNLATNAIVENRDFIAYTDNNQASIYNKDSVLNLTDGSYEVTYQFLLAPGYYQADIANNDSDIPCSVIVDTVVIAPYQFPQMTAGNAIRCNNDINFVLIPDSTKGVPPYQYEIISGPQTFPVQSSNIFTSTEPGTYLARIFDVCGNASTKQIAVDTIAFDPISMNTDCNNKSLIFPASVYTVYEWLTPNSQTFTGDSLILDPLTPADTGTYYISKIVNINGCTDTLYTSYHVTLNNYLAQTIPFCTGTEVQVGTSIYDAPGIYHDTLTSIGGCDSIVVTTLMILPPISDTLHISICPQESYLFGGTSYGSSGFYRDTLVASQGCDSISVLHLTIQPYIQNTITRSICTNESFNFGGQLLTTGGIYRDTLQTAHCDSIVTLNLIVGPYKYHTITQNICQGDDFVMGGNNYSLSGTYRDTLSTATCDSVITLNLNVLPYKHNTITLTICQGYPYTMGNHTYTLTGIYTDTLSTATCDSIITLNLTVLPSRYNTITQSICEGDSYTIGNHTYTLSGIYTDTLFRATCDSVITLNLSVLTYKYNAITQSICEGDSYTMGNHTYTLPGIYADTLSTAACDSIVTLTLNVFPKPALSMSVDAFYCYKTGAVAVSPTPVGGTLTGDFVAGTGLDLAAAAPGNYAVTYNYTGANGCGNTLTKPFLVTTPLVPGFVYSSDCFQNATFVNTTQPALGTTTYSWSYDNGTEASTAVNPSITYSQPGEYVMTMMATDSYHCSYPVIQPISITEGVNMNDFVIPNVITPNGDGVNDVLFLPAILEECIQYKIVILNRWGNPVYEMNSAQNAFSGRDQGGKELSEGVYFYIVKSDDIDCKDEQKGFCSGMITVVR
jgi:gliding motility-associated-like protein